MLQKKTASQVNLDQSHADPQPPDTSECINASSFNSRYFSHVQFTQPNVHVSWNILTEEKKK